MAIEARIDVCRIFKDAVEKEKSGNEAVPETEEVEEKEKVGTHLGPHKSLL